MTNKSYQQIKADLQALGICKGTDLLIHASYKALGAVDGGIETLIEAILSCLGDSGTLLMPALSYDSVHKMDVPTFDIQNTPSCVGAVTEYFRNYPGVKRSMHPTHSVCAIGCRQDEYLAKHVLDNEPVGENSPFALLPHFNGKILMLGCGTKPNTSMHGIEEFAKTPYILSDFTRAYTLIDENGVQTEKNYYVHYIRQNGYAQRYDRLENILDMRAGNVLQADVKLIDSKQMWKVATEKLKEDVYYFTDKLEG